MEYPVEYQEGEQVEYEYDDEQEEYWGVQSFTRIYWNIPRIFKKSELICDYA